MYRRGPQGRDRSCCCSRSPNQGTRIRKRITEGQRSCSCRSRRLVRVQQNPPGTHHLHVAARYGTLQQRRVVQHPARSQPVHLVPGYVAHHVRQPRRRRTLGAACLCSCSTRPTRARVRSSVPHARRQIRENSNFPTAAFATEGQGVRWHQRHCLRVVPHCARAGHTPVIATPIPRHTPVIATPNPTSPSSALLFHTLLTRLCRALASLRLWS